MSDYDNTNRWTLFRNERKDKPSQPEFTGSINIDGVEYWLNAWTKEGNGKKFFSGTVKPKEQRAAATTGASRMGALIDDDIPFAPEWR